MSSQQLRVRYNPIHAASSRICIPYRDGHGMSETDVHALFDIAGTSFDDLHTGPDATWMRQAINREQAETNASVGRNPDGSVTVVSSATQNPTDGSTFWQMENEIF